MAELINRLFYGQNLDILRDLPTDSIDLVYLDPPFNSNATYSAIFTDESGNYSDAQIQAFQDTWRWGPTARDHLAYLINTSANGGKVNDRVAHLMGAFDLALGKTPILAYVVEMTVRLIELQRVLKRTGSLYLHADPVASHYLKLILDAIFGPINFRNEIIWKRFSAHNSAKRYGPVHDVILYYARSEDCIWNQQYQPHDPAYLASHYRNHNEQGRAFTLSDLTADGTRKGSSGQPWRGFDPATKGNHWKFTLANLARLDAEGRIYWPAKGGWPRYKRYLDQVRGIPLQDVWTDITPVNSQAKERRGYPTQKPIALLDRIIGASSNPGDIVLDPFCGCGTAVESAQGLGRSWIGIDVTYLAIAEIQERMRERFGSRIQIEGSPTEVEGARRLAQQLPNGRDQFELWALTLVGAIPQGGSQKKGADQGVDGVINFTGNGGQLETAIVSVKSGHVQANMVQQLKGAMETHRAAMGLFVTLEEPTRPMQQEATAAGTYLWDAEEPAREYPRLQILPVSELLKRDGIRPQLPPLLSRPFRATLWPEEELPPREKVHRRRHLRPTRPPEVAPVMDRAVPLRDGYAARGQEPSPEAPPSLHKSKRGQPVPLPSPESVGTD